MSLAPTMAKLREAWHARTDVLVTKARHAWQQRTPREQTLLRAGAVLLAIALLWTIALRPALNTIQKARQQLPSLQVQATQLSAIILEAKALGRGRSGALPAAETEAALKAGLSRAGLDTVGVLGQPDNPASDETQWQVRFTNAPAGRIIEWMTDLPFIVQVQTRRVDLARSNVNGRDRPGLLTGTILLALPSKEAR